MAVDSLVKSLLHVELFQGLKPLQLTEIARRAFRTVYKPGDTIIRASTEGDAAVLIVSGEAVRVQGPDAAFSGERIPEGTLLGEMAMLIETEHSSTVVAKTTVRALRIARRELHEQMSEDTDLAHHFVGRISNRLRDVALELHKIDDALGQMETGPDNDGARSPERRAGSPDLHTHIN